MKAVLCQLCFFKKQLEYVFTLLLLSLQPLCIIFLLHVYLSHDRLSSILEIYVADYLSVQKKTERSSIF